MDLGLNGKIALVTGAGSGVGREIARSLAAEGAIVAVSYRSSGDDVAHLSGVKAMVDAIVEDLGGLDILINNAGLALRKRFVETTPEDWRAQIDACLYGAIHCCH